jgi:hypothetical protein
LAWALLAPSAMAPSLYLVNPVADCPTYYGAEVFAALGRPGTTYMADLAITTLAALVPDDFTLRLCDENVTAVDFDCGADVVGITGKITQVRRMIEIAAGFRARGTTVMMGGPCASLSPDLLREHCDVLVCGEVEEIAPALFADLRSRRPRDEYVGTRPDLAASPIPRWDLYPNHRAVSGTVQTSRGCPFECEFCDVIQYLGRKQRHKPIGAVLAELDVLYRLGYRSVFLADDNFTAYRARAKDLQAALADWNARQDGGPIRFVTQVSIDAARDEELLELLAVASVTQVFIGIESPNEESLRAAKKRQNVRVDLRALAGRFIEHGITVYGGIMVGFDHDGPDIFARQREFLGGMPIPIYSIGALMAPASTPLHDRMARDGRLVAGPEVAALPWATNIVPRRMSRATLVDGLRRLCNELYAPDALADRTVALLRALKRPDASTKCPAHRATARPPRRAVMDDLREVVASVASLGDAELRLCLTLDAESAGHPAARYAAAAVLVQYRQIRHMYEHGGFWNEHGAESLAATR